MVLTTAYFRFRLKRKRNGIFLAIALYIITFFYISTQTKQASKKVSISNLDRDTNYYNNTYAKQSSLSKQSEVKRIIAVLVLVCDRSSVTRTLDQLLKYRPDSTLFPIVLSQDCGDDSDSVNSLVRKKYDKKLIYLKHPNYKTILATLGDIPDHMRGYYHIAAHYRWALNYTFDKLGFDNVIIVEDDLDISPDFFEYFQATLPLLYSDNSLWCVSAYNDNGKTELIDLEAPELLLRTDFFPGLGWMLTKEIWAELNGKWPRAFWDDWMRLPDQRKDRACIHSEISRTKTFGRIGASNGQFFDMHLKSIELNKKFIDFKSLNLSYLLKDQYDTNFFKRVSASTRVKFLEELETIVESSNNAQSSYQLSYKGNFEFKKIARKVGLMDDFKSGVPRGGYNGIVPLMYRKNRLYLVPS